MAGQQLVLRVIGDADQGVIDEFRFYSGEERVLKLQVIADQDKQKWPIPDASTEITLTISGTPDDVEIATADITVDSVDRSIFTTTLTEDDTEKMITGQIFAEIQYSDGVQTVTRFALKEHATSKIAS